MVDIKDKLRCSKCGSGQVYSRLKTKEQVCRTCGNVEPIKEDSEALKEGQDDSS